LGRRPVEIGHISARNAPSKKCTKSVIYAIASVSQSRHTPKGESCNRRTKPLVTPVAVNPEKGAKIEVIVSAEPSALPVRKQTSSGRNQTHCG